MLNVLQTQLYRLKRSKLFWALFIVCGLLPLVGMLLTTALMSVIADIFTGDAAGTLAAIRQSSGELTMSTLTGISHLSSNPALFSLICSSIFLSGEFSGGAIRNMVLANKSRTQIFFSFFSVAMIIGVSYMGVAFASTLLFYGLALGFGGVTAANVLSGIFASLFLGLLAIAMVQGCVCMFVFCTRKTGPTVAFPLLIIILAPSIVSAVVSLVTGLKILVGQDVTIEALSWIPLYNIDMFSASAVDGAIVGKIAMYNAPIAALFASMGWLSIYKADLK